MSALPEVPPTVRESLTSIEQGARLIRRQLRRHAAGDTASLEDFLHRVDQALWETAERLVNEAAR